MKETVVKVERCDVACEYCNSKYPVIVDEGEIPLICDHCGVPSLRVVDRWDTGYRNYMVSID